MPFSGLNGYSYCKHYFLITVSIRQLYVAIVITVRVFGQWPCYSSPHSVQDKFNSLVSLFTLSNQDREFHKEVILSARWTHGEQGPPVLVPTSAMAEEGKLAIPALPPVICSYQTGPEQCLRKRKRQREPDMIILSLCKNWKWFKATGFHANFW